MTNKSITFIFSAMVALSLVSVRHAHALTFTQIPNNFIALENTVGHTGLVNVIAQGNDRITSISVSNLTFVSGELDDQAILTSFLIPQQPPFNLGIIYLTP